MAKNKDSVVLYESFFEATEELEAVAIAEIWRAIRVYLQGEEPEFTDAGAKLAWKFIRLQLNADREKWAQTCERRSEAAKIGNAKRWAQEEPKADLSQKSQMRDLRQTQSQKSQKVANVADTDTESESDKKEKNKKEKAEGARGGADAPFLSILSFGGSERFVEAWKDWERYRRERKLAKWTRQTLDAKAKTFEQWGEARTIESIRQSIANGWQGLFEPKGAGGSGATITLEQFRAAYRDQHGADLDCDFCDAKAHHLSVLKCQTIDEVREMFSEDYEDILALWTKEFSPLKRRVMGKLERK